MSEVVSPKAIKTLRDFRLFFQVKSNWDGILVTDGSGTSWYKSTGWCGVLLLKAEQEPQFIGGSMTHGTNNTAELMAVFNAALFLAEQDYGVKEHGFQLYVISDSTYVVKGLENLTNGKEDGGTVWASTQSANRPLWLGLLGCQRKGIIYHPRHVGRNELPTGLFCHNVANDFRKQAIKLKSHKPPLDWEE